MTLSAAPSCPQYAATQVVLSRMTCWRPLVTVAYVQLRRFTALGLRCATARRRCAASSNLACGDGVANSEFCPPFKVTEIHELPAVRHASLRRRPRVRCGRKDRDCEIRGRPRDHPSPVIS
jgi:hypothetical protein